VLFQTKQGADAGARTLSDWFRSDWPAFRLIAPELSVAELLTLDEAHGGAGLAPQWTDDRALLAASTPVATPRVLSPGRLTGRDRRAAGERRVAVIPTADDRRSGPDRRSRLERRSGAERRSDPVSTEPLAPIEARRIAPPWRRREAFHSR